MAPTHRIIRLDSLAGWTGAAHRVWPGRIALFDQHLNGSGHPWSGTPWRADHVLMVMVRSGMLEMHTYEDDALCVGAGEGLVVHANVLRSLALRGTAAAVTVLAFTPEFVDDLALKPMQEGLWRLALERTGSCVIPATDVARIEEPLQRLAHRIEHLADHPRGRELVQHTFMELCLEFSAGGDCPEHGTSATNGRKEELVARFVDLAQEHHVHRRRLSFYSERLAVTSKHLSETVKDVTGRTAMQVLNDLLVSRSKSLLHERGRSISQVAYDLAFGDPTVFSKFFKRMTGRSPREFRAGGMHAVSVLS